jgi:broad specificity phosphatase PhoE
MLLLARHGRTALNAQGLLQGRVDAPLDDVGAEQAAALGRVPSIRAASRVVCSPLGRARQTAEAMGLPVTVDERWIEIDYGPLDGTPLSEVPASVWSSWRADPSWAPEGGESLTAVGERVAAACADLVEEAAERDVVVVSHVSPLKAALGWALGAGDAVAFRIHLAPASLNRIAVAPGRPPVVHSVNETAHLSTGT